MTSWNEFDAEPPVDYHGAVMVDVKKRHLTVLLAHDEEHLPTVTSQLVLSSSQKGRRVCGRNADRIKKFDDFTEEEDPTHARHLQQQLDITKIETKYMCTLRNRTRMARGDVE